MRFFLGIFVFLVCFQMSCSRSQGYLFQESPYREEFSNLDMTRKVAQLGQPKKHIVIFDFWNDTPFQVPAIGAFSASELKRVLFLSKNVIFSQHLILSFKTKDFVQGNHIRVAQLIREGRKLGVSVVILGRISKVVFRQEGDEVGLFRQKNSIASIELEVKLFDIQEGREILAYTREGESSSSAFRAFVSEDREGEVDLRKELVQLAIRDAVNKIAPRILRDIGKLSWEGRVAKVVGKYLYINAGKRSGLMIGDILKILTPGIDVYDPQTGAHLGKTKGEMKGTVEVVDFMGADGSKAKIYTGGNFQKGDLVRLY